MFPVSIYKISNFLAIHLFNVYNEHEYLYTNLMKNCVKVFSIIIRHKRNKSNIITHHEMQPLKDMILYTKSLM